MAQNNDTSHLTENGIHSEHRIAGVRTVLFGKVKRSPSEVEMMVDVIERQQPDVVHTNTFWHNADLWHALAARNVPIVHTLREYKLACPNNMHLDSRNCASICESCALAARINRVRSDLVTSVVGISRFVLDRHLQLGFFADAPHRVVIPNSVHVSTPAEPPPPGGALRLGYLGRLHPSKGVDALIDAVAGRPDGDVSLTIAGAIQDQAIDRKLTAVEGDPRIEYLGFVEPVCLFSTIDVLVVPSCWSEPFGRVVVEAFAHGIPVLAANTGGLPESVTVGKTGWLFENEAGALSAAIDRLAAEKTRILAMRQACLAATSRYSPERISEEYETLYEKTVRARRGRNGHRPATNGQKSRTVNLKSFRYLVRPQRSNGAMRPPRVLVITGAFPKLSETFVTNHICGLIKEGADVTVFAERRGEPDQWHADVDRYHLLDRCLWYGMPEGLRSARDYLCQNARKIEKELAKLLGACSIMAMPPPLDALVREVIDEQVRTDLKIRLFHAAEVLVASGREFDVVHCHFGHRGLLAAELRRMNALTGQIVVSFHGIDLTEHVSRKGTRLYDGLKSECGLYLPISNFFRERLLRLGISPRQTVVHHVGVDCDRFRFRARSLAPRETVRILTVGRLVAKKGTEYAIRALGVLVKRGFADSLHCDVIGDGPERGALEKLAAELRLGDHVTFHGDAAHDQVAAMMERSHLFLAPSVTASDGDMEGIPTAIMEAMASGMPVISTMHSGIPELVKDKETGLLCKERDFEALASAIQFLAANHELWPDFGRAGRHLVETEFNVSVQNARLMEMYKDLVVADEGGAVTAVAHAERTNVESAAGRAPARKRASGFFSI